MTAAGQLIRLLSKTADPINRIILSSCVCARAFRFATRISSEVVYRTTNDHEPRRSSSFRRALLRPVVCTYAALAETRRPNKNRIKRQKKTVGDAFPTPPPPPPHVIYCPPSSPRCSDARPRYGRGSADGFRGFSPNQTNQTNSPKSCVSLAAESKSERSFRSRRLTQIFLNSFILQTLCSSTTSASTKNECTL